MIDVHQTIVARVFCDECMREAFPKMYFNSIAEFKNWVITRPGEEICVSCVEKADGQT